MGLLRLASLCGVAGAVIAAAAAILCLLASVQLDPATRHSIHAASVLWPAYRNAWPLGVPDDAQVLACSGVGYTGFEVRWKSGEAADSRISRFFVTSLGWPQPVLSTGSESIGRYSAVDLPGWTLANDELVRASPSPGPTTTVNWPGVLFNSVTFGLPLLAIAVWFPRLVRAVGSKSRWMITVAAVAWTLALVLPEWVLVSARASGPGYPALTRRTAYSKPEDFFVQGFDLFTPADDSSERFQGFEATDFAVTYRCQSLLRLNSDGNSASVLRRGEVMSAGWPFRAFVAGDATTQLVPASDLSQFEVRWLSWFVNVALFGLALAVFFAPAGVRRMRRHLRGQCLGCGYPLGGGSICPECGRASSPRRLSNDQVAPLDRVEKSPPPTSQ